MRESRFYCDVCGKDLETEKKTRFLRIKKFFYYVVPLFSFSPFDSIYNSKWITDDTKEAEFDLCEKCFDSLLNCIKEKKVKNE